MTDILDKDISVQGTTNTLESGNTSDVSTSECPDGMVACKSLADAVAENDVQNPPDKQAQLHFMAVRDLLDDDSSAQLRDVSLQRCREFMSRGVPIDPHNSWQEDAPATPGERLLLLFVGYEWPASHAEDIEQLFRDYVRTKVIPLKADLDDRLSVVLFDHHRISPLEYAITNGKTRLMAALIEEGADYSEVPKKGLTLLNGTVLVEPGAFLEFVKVQHHLGADVVAEMYAVASAALMRRHIADLGSSIDCNLAPAPMRVRRAGL